MDFVGKRNCFFIFSAILILVGVVSMSISPRFKVGIEFEGGSALSLTFAQAVDEDRLRSAMSDLGHGQAVVQRVGDTGVLIRTTTLEGPGNDGGVSERDAIEERLTEEFGTIEISELSAVSEAVAKETIRNAGIAVGVAALFIMIYISFAFRLMANSMRLGVAAIVAALHDVIITLGAFSILGKVVDLEVNAMFITGILTVVGYSVHDTIVVFDRIRENTARRVSRDMSTTINISIMETIGRSLTTSLTTLTVIVALLLMGGGTIESLLYTLLIGVIVGTYSSIAIASQLLLVWEERGMNPFRRREEAEA
ncbi:MAG: protein translocase subunit SecF [SAR202 cluster bacterium]|nr:protein translocase subunit SecF [SAR202 cluster bacterium]